MRALVVYLIAFAALGVGAWFALPEWFGREASAQLGSERSSAAATAPPVVVMPVRRAQFHDTLEALGTVFANESVELTAAASDHITQLHFDDGAQVQAGDLLLVLESAEERAQLAEAASLRDDRKVNLDSAEELFAQDMISERELDVARTALAAAEARVTSLQAAIQDRELRAPFAGVLGLRRISVGAFVRPSDIVTTLDDLSVVKLDFTIPETWLASVRAGMTIEATCAAWPDAAFAGQISQIDTRLDASSRSATVRAVLPNPDTRLRPGMLMQVIVQRGEAPVLQVPEEAIIPVGSDTFVLRVDEARVAHRVPVEVGRRRPGAVEITSGLDIDDRVVIEGILRVRDGLAVNVVAIREP